MKQLFVFVGAILAGWVWTKGGRDDEAFVIGALIWLVSAIVLFGEDRLGRIETRLIDLDQRLDKVIGKESAGLR